MYTVSLIQNNQVSKSFLTHTVHNTCRNWN